MKTSDYPYYQCSFHEFNKAQVAAVPFLDQDVNLIIAFNTSVGKTAIAECAFGFHLNTEENSKVLYISPFKGISNERYRDWNKNDQFKKHGICLSTGDSFAERNELEKARIIILTSESLDSKTRNSSYHEWLKDVSCIVFDEAHLLGHEERGSNVESAIMRITKINPSSRIILLSATMSNAIQLAKWIKSLNSKITKCIQSNWRPTKIEIKYHSYDDSNYVTSETEKLEYAVRFAADKPFGDKMIIFVHSKKTGKAIVKALKLNGINTVFHNASLNPKARAKYEQMFNSQISGLDIIVSTSTLSSGVNVG